MVNKRNVDERNERLENEPKRAKREQRNGTHTKQRNPNISR